jgi:ribosomal-protein-alanine N-acetyltransferase
MRIIARTSRFMIREFKAEEEDMYLSLFDDEEVTVHLPKRTKEENRRLFRETLQEYAENSLCGRWGMFTTDDTGYMGMCLLRYFEGCQDKMELGYVLHKKYWGQGIASEMAQIMTGHAFKQTGARQVVAVTTFGNLGSQKVLEKAGFKRMDNYVRAGEEVAFFCIESI